MNYLSINSLTGLKDWRWIGDGPSCFKQARCFLVPYPLCLAIT